MANKMERLKHPDTDGECIVPESTARVLKRRGWRPVKDPADTSPVKDPADTSPAKPPKPTGNAGS